MKSGLVHIPPSEVNYHPLSYCDPNGRLFWWQGQLYRGIKRGGEFYRQLFQDGIPQRLIDKGLLVQTELTDLVLDGYELVLRHRSVPFVSYPHEWCGEMFKEAALLNVDLLMELARHGLALQDATPWNILFEGSRPVFVDFCSLMPADQNRIGKPNDQFYRYFIHPLELMAHGHERIARSLTQDSNQFVFWFYLPAFISRPYDGFHTRQASRYLLKVAKHQAKVALRSLMPNEGMAPLHGLLSKPIPRLRHIPLDALEQLRQRIAGIAIPSLPMERREASEGRDPPLEPSEEWASKHRHVQRVLSDLRPSSVLDIGDNQGWFSQCAALHGSTVVACDVHEESVARLYRDARQKDLPILPLVMNFRSPAQVYGRYSQRLAPATERLRCIMVSALALLHHLVFEQHLNFEQITDELSTFSNRWLLVEFIPRDDRYVRKWWSEQYSWYTLENFITALRRKFQRIKMSPSYPDQRLLLLCEK